MIGLKAAGDASARLSALAYGVTVLVLAAVPVAAQSGRTAVQAASCPERIRTIAATPADPTQIAGFKPITGSPTGAQAFLQDLAIQAGPVGAGTPVKGKEEGKKRIVWSFDGSMEVTAVCIYEGGITLSRSVGRPKSCSAAIQRSTNPGKDGGWGMENASFRCS